MKNPTQYVLFVKRVEFEYDDYKHLGRYKDWMKGGCQLSGSIHSCAIGDSEIDCFKKIYPYLKNFIMQLPPVIDGHIKPDDLRFVSMLEEVNKDGTFWDGQVMQSGSSKSLPELKTMIEEYER